MNGEQALGFLRWAYVAFIVATSLRSALTAGDNRFVLGLATVEIVAALAFLLAVRIERVAVAVLLAVFAIAGMASLADGDVVALLRFAYYAMTALALHLARPRASSLTA